MARFVTEIATGNPDDMIRFIAEDFFAKEGFVLTSDGGQMVWKKGSGFFTAPQYIQMYFQNGVVHLEAWLKFAILPGVYAGEMGLTGFWGFAVKQQLKGRVDMLLYLLQQPNPAVAATAAAGSPGWGQQAPGAAPAVPADRPAAPQPIPVRVHDPVDKAKLALVTGIFSLAAAWFIPLAGVVLGVVAIPAGNVGRKSSAQNIGLAGFICGIAGTALSLIIWLARLISMFSYL